MFCLSFSVPLDSPTSSYATAVRECYRFAIEVAYFAGPQGFEPRMDNDGWGKLMVFVETAEQAVLLKLRWPDRCLFVEEC